MIVKPNLVNNYFKYKLSKQTVKRQSSCTILIMPLILAFWRQGQVDLYEFEIQPGLHNMFQGTQDYRIIPCHIYILVFQRCNYFLSIHLNKYINTHKLKVEELRNVWARKKAQMVNTSIHRYTHSHTCKHAFTHACTPYTHTCQPEKQQKHSETLSDSLFEKKHTRIQILP